MKRKFTAILVVAVVAASLFLCGLLSGCGPKEKPSEGNTTLVSVSGGKFANGKSIQSFEPGKVVKITAQEKLGEDGKPDTFVRWTDEEGNELATTEKFSYTVPESETGV